MANFMDVTSRAKLASAHVPAGDLNAGFHDQRAALAFLQDNIQAFGGDAKKVCAGSMDMTCVSRRMHR